MKKIFVIFLTLICLNVSAQDMSQKFEYIKTWMIQRVEIGTRIEYFKLKKDTSSSFIGSVDRLEEEQDYDPTRVFVDINLGEYAYNEYNIDYGVEFTWTRMEVETVTSSDGHKDSSLVLSGPVFSFYGKYKNNSKFTPYAGIGLVYFNHVRTKKGWWHYGFPLIEGEADDLRYNEWRANGSPSWPNGGYTRTFELDKSWGWLLSFGSDFSITSAISADFYFRYTSVDVDNKFSLAHHGTVDRIENNTFPLSSYVLGIGVKYKFK